jgi:hypothetical protein
VNEDVAMEVWGLVVLSLPMSRTYGVNRSVAAGHISSSDDVLGKRLLEVVRED